MSALIFSAAAAEALVCPDPQFNDEDAALIEAAASSDIRRVVALLEAGKGDPNVRDKQCHTAVLWAVRGGHIAVFLELVERGGDMETSLPPPDGRSARDFATRLGAEEVLQHAEAVRARFAKREFRRLVAAGHLARAIGLIERGVLDGAAPLDDSGTTALTLLAGGLAKTSPDERAAIADLELTEDSDGWSRILEAALTLEDWVIVTAATPRTTHEAVWDALHDALAAGRVEAARRILEALEYPADHRDGGAPPLILAVAKGAQLRDDAARELVSDILAGIRSPNWLVWAEVANELGDKKLFRRAALAACAPDAHCPLMKATLRSSLTESADKSFAPASMILAETGYVPDRQDLEILVRDIPPDASASLLKAIPASKRAAIDSTALQNASSTVVRLIAEGAASMSGIADILIRDLEAPVSISSIDRLAGSTPYSDAVLDTLLVITETEAWQRSTCPGYGRNDTPDLARSCRGGSPPKIECRKDWAEVLVGRMLASPATGARSEDLESIVTGLVGICGTTQSADVMVGLAASIEHLEQSVTLLRRLKANGTTIPWKKAGHVCTRIAAISEAAGQGAAEHLSLIAAAIAPEANENAYAGQSPVACAELIGRGVPGTTADRIRYLAALGEAGFDLDDTARAELRRIARFGGHAETAAVTLGHARPAGLVTGTDLDSYLRFVAAHPESPGAGLLETVVSEGSLTRRRRFAVAIDAYATFHDRTLPRSLLVEINRTLPDEPFLEVCGARRIFKAVLPEVGPDCLRWRKCNGAGSVSQLLLAVQDAGTSQSAKSCASNLLADFLTLAPEGPDFARASRHLIAGGAGVEARTVALAASNDELLGSRHGAPIMTMLLDATRIDEVEDTLIESSSAICSRDSTVRQTVERYVAGRFRLCDGD